MTYGVLYYDKLMKMSLELNEYFKNKFDEFGNIVRNKAPFVTQGYTQIERVDFDETFSLVVRLESIQLMLALSCCLKFKLYHMDVKVLF